MDVGKLLDGVIVDDEIHIVEYKIESQCLGIDGPT
jgi:hypothetical protein